MLGWLNGAKIIIKAPQMVLSTELTSVFSLGYMTRKRIASTNNDMHIHPSRELAWKPFVLLRRM